MKNGETVASNYDKARKSAMIICDDILLKNIEQLLEYRKKVAIEMLKSQPESSYQHLSEIYDYSCFRIKELLGL